MGEGGAQFAPMKGRKYSLRKELKGLRVQIEVLLRRRISRNLGTLCIFCDMDFQISLRRIAEATVSRLVSNTREHREFLTQLLCAAESLFSANAGRCWARRLGWFHPTLAELGWGTRRGFFDVAGEFRGPDLVMNSSNEQGILFNSGLFIDQATVTLRWAEYAEFEAACRGVGSLGGR